MECLRPRQGFLLIPVLLLAITGWSVAEDEKKESTPAKEATSNVDSLGEAEKEQKQDSAPAKQAESKPNYQFIVIMTSAYPKPTPVKAPALSAVPLKDNGKRVAHVIGHVPQQMVYQDNSHPHTKVHKLLLKCEAITLEAVPAENEGEDYKIKCTGPVELTISGPEGPTRILAEGLEYSQNQIRLSQVQLSSPSLDMASETIRLNFPIQNVSVQPYGKVSVEYYNVTPPNFEPAIVPQYFDPKSSQSVPTFEAPPTPPKGEFNSFPAG